MKQWVIDTWVLAKCCDCDSMEYMDCMSFMAMILENGTLCLDIEGDIEKEYDPYIKPRTYLSRWWERVVWEKHQVYFYSNKLKAKCEIYLIKKLGFDVDDIKFVGVASRTNDKLLMSGDSDYSEVVCAYLSGELGIIVKCPDEAISL